jgi:SWIM zinc finger
MTQTQFETRQERAENGALVASKTDEGYRVYSLHNPGQIYLVRQEGEHWTCTCPDFESHKADQTWRCKHILAVAPWPQTPAPAAPNPPAEPPANALPAAAPPEKPAAPKGKARQSSEPVPPALMLIKRSVSPDGRIDSVSVEFSMPVCGEKEDDIKAKAVKTLQLQREIVASFLKLNGHAAAAAPSPSAPPAPTNGGNGGPVFARMLDIGKMNGRWGERLFITFLVNDRRCRLFGSSKQLATHLGSAGYEIDPEGIEEGLRLNLPCRVTTKPSDDGKYVNVDQVFPLKGNAPTGGGNGSNIPY